MFSHNGELLAFRQTLAENIPMSELERLSIDCAENFFIYVPDRIEFIPEVFKGINSNETIQSVIEYPVNFFGDKILILNQKDRQELPNDAQITNISKIDIVIKLFSISDFNSLGLVNLFVFRKDNGFHLFALKKEKILFANTFEFVSYEEILYFSLNVLKDLGFSQEDAVLYYSSNDYSQAAADFWKPYFKSAVELELALKMRDIAGSTAFDLNEFMLLMQAPKCV